MRSPDSSIAWLGPGRTAAKVFRAPRKRTTPGAAEIRVSGRSLNPTPVSTPGRTGWRPLRGGVVIPLVSTVTKPHGGVLAGVRKALLAAATRAPAGSRVESDGSFEAGCPIPVYHMSPRNRAAKSPKFLTHSSLLIPIESSPSRSPGCLVKSAVSCSESHPAGRTPRCSVRNPESHLGGHPAGYWAGYPPENPARNRDACLDRNPAGCSTDCPDNRSEGNPESNMPSNGADNLPDDLEGDSADSGPDWFGSCLPMSESRWLLRSRPRPSPSYPAEPPKSAAAERPPRPYQIPCSRGIRLLG